MISHKDTSLSRHTTRSFEGSAEDGNQ